MNLDSQRVREIFDGVTQLDTAAERAAFLDQACGGKRMLRERIEAMLRKSAEAEAFFPTGEMQAPSQEALRAVNEGPCEPVAGSGPRAASGTTIGRYKLLEPIGEGGFGVVYMAEQLEPVRRRVAFKVIKLGMDTKEVIARFEAERQALALMDHPNVARVLDAGATGSGRPFFVMELVKGVPLTTYCDKNHLGTRERLDLFIPVCQAVQHAHQKGIIHRDLKPSNILVTLHDGKPVPKVIDFGVAKAIHQPLTEKTLFTHYGQMIGTPAYMSPEQAELSGLDVDTRSDVYSLGVLLYELLTGKPPFDPERLRSAGFSEMQRIIREEEPMRPSTRLSTLGGELAVVAHRRGADPPKLIHLLRGDLDWMVMKCLEKDRARRYDSAAALAQDIKRHLENEPVSARSPSTLYRLRKLVYRNKLAVAAAAAVTLSLVFGTIVSALQAVRATRAEAVARAAQTAAEGAREAERQERLRADSEKMTAQRLLYLANMNLAQQAWEQDNIGWLQELLEDTKTSPDRGFEWFYWQQQTHLAWRTFCGHLGGVRSVAFSPDGRRIVTGSDDQMAKVWEVASGRELLTLKGHRAAVFSVAFSPDGRRIVTGSDDKTARVWDAATGSSLVTLKWHRVTVSSVAFSPDGERVVTGSYDQTAKVWEAATGRELLLLKGHLGDMTSVAFSPDGHQIVTGNTDCTVRLWDAANGSNIVTHQGYDSAILSAAFASDGQRVVTGYLDGAARVWDSATGKELVALAGHRGGVWSVAFSPDGQRIVTGSDDRLARLWDAAHGSNMLTLKGHTAGIRSVAFSPDGQWVVSGGEDKTARLWSLVDAQGLCPLKGQGAGAHVLTVSLDHHRIVIGSPDGTATVTETGTARELLTLKGRNGGIWSATFSPDGRRIVTRNGDRTATVWDAVRGGELLTLNGHSSSIWSVAWSADGRRIVTGSADKTAKVWDAATGRELHTLKGHRAPVWSVAVSADGLRIVTGSGDQTARVWEAVTGRELLTIKGLGAMVNCTTFSPDGERILTASGVGKVWDAISGRELFTLKGHDNMISSVAFSRDGRRIVTGSEDQTAKVWDAATGRELLTLRGDRPGISGVAFSPDGLQILTTSAYLNPKMWGAASSDQVQAWHEEERAAAQHLADLAHERAAELDQQRRGRAGDNGAIKRWLILAPIPLTDGQSGGEALQAEQIQGEALLRPRAGETMSIGKVELKWQEVVLEDYIIDFNAILGDLTAQSVAYAVCYIQSEADQPGLQLLVGSDDEAKVYLNGKQVHKSDIPHSFFADQYVVPDIRLSKGLNVLVFKVVNEMVHWQGSVRFIDSQGAPLKGIEVTLTP